jgi:hypothetical protein
MKCCDKTFHQEYSHVFEKYWDYLPCLNQHRDFSSESSYCQEHMMLFTCALSSYCLDGFEATPAAEANQSDLEIAEDTAISRLRPIQDGPDQWMEHRSSAVPVSGSLAPV